MQLQEVKNDIAKITYNPTDNRLLPADFILIEDINQKLIAQIIRIETTTKSTNNLAVLRLALAIDKDDNLSYYNGYIPSKTSKIIYINSDEIMELIKGPNENLFLGVLSNHNDCFAKPSISFLKDKMYIQTDRDDKAKVIIQNIILQLKEKNKKTILLDFDGSYSSSFNIPKLKITKNFKLPLNVEAFNTILENDTTDCPLEDKAVIQSIVLELREYLSTLENNFLPFTVFKNVVDNEFMASPISGLMLLRNKLWLYAQEGIFAESRIQYDVINSALMQNNAIIIDASNVEEKWYKFVIQTVLELTNRESYLLLSLNDVDMDKKSIINLFNSKLITPVVTTNYENKYRQLLKSLCKNFILFKPTNVLNEEPYGALLNKINTDEFIAYGDATLYLPLIIDCNSITGKTTDDILENEIKKDVDKLFTISAPIVPPAPEIKPIKIEQPLQPQQINKDVDGFTDSDFEFLDELDDLEDLDDLKPTEQKPQPTVEEIYEPEIKTEKENYSVFEPINTTASYTVEQKDEQTDSNTPDIKLENSEILEEEPLNEKNQTGDILDEMFTIKEESENQAVQSIENSENTKEKVQAAQNSDIELVNEAKEEINEPELLPEVEPEIENIEEVEPDILLEDDDSQEENSNEIEIQDNSENIEEKTDEHDIDSDVPKEEEKEETAEQQKSPIEENEENAEQEEPKTVLENLVNKIEVNAAEQQEQNQPHTREQEQTQAVQQEEEEIEPPPVKEIATINKTPELTVYETDLSAKLSEKDVPFKIGDKVYHPKHGTGVVEGFANYSNKILFCQIEFENVGRRILDPRVSGLQKIS